MAGRRARLVLALSLVFAVQGCGSAGPGAAATASPPVDPAAARVDRLLDHSRVESIVGERAPGFTRQVALLAEDLTDEELELLVPAVTEAFRADKLRDDVARFLRAEDPGGQVEAALAWLDDGSYAELDRLTDGYEPTTTLEEFIQEFMAAPPDEERVRLVAEWAEVQGAGDFFVLMEQALSQAAHSVVAELRPGSPAFEPLSGPPLFEQLERSFNAAVISFLHTLEPVPNEVLRGAIDEYASESGRWYVETYSLAVAEAMRAGGQRTIAALREGEAFSPLSPADDRP